MPHFGNPVFPLGEHWAYLGWDFCVRNASAHGMRTVLWSSLGNICGLFCLSSAAMLGLGAMLMTSAWLFAVMKLAGALYLFWLGIQHWRRAGLALPVHEAASAAPAASAAWREGALLAVTNPKPVLFFAALFPQFMSTSEPVGPQFAVLTGIFMVLSMLTLCTAGMLARRSRRVLARPTIGRLLNRIAGTAFIGFGAALLAWRRPVG